MTGRDVEGRVRGLAWPAPSPNLRTRVLADAASHAAGALDARRGNWTPQGDPGPPPRRRWRLVPAFVVIGALIVIGACAGFDIWAGHELDREIARLEAKYGSLDEPTSQVPAVPDADNRAQVVRAAAALAVPRSDTKYHYIQLPVASPVPAALRAFADANRDAIRVAWDIRSRRQSNWEIDYRTGANSPRWDSIRIVSDALHVSALLDVEAGRADEAAQKIVSGLGIGASFRQEPGLLPLQSLALWLFQAIRQLVTTSTPSTTALTELAWWLAENRAPDAMQIYLRTQMNDVNGRFTRMERGDIDPNTASWVWPSAYRTTKSEKLIGLVAQIGRPLVRTAHVRYLQHMERLIDGHVGTRPRPAIPEPEPPKPWALIDRLVDRFTAGTWRENDLWDDAASALDTTAIAVALRRYKMDRGAYPDQLPTLVPTYLDRLPIDPYTGRPPVYARQGSGFTLRATNSNPNAVKWRALEWNVPK